MSRHAVLVGTRKGLFILKSGRDRSRRSMQGPHFLGEIVNHAVLDPRDGRALLAAVRDLARRGRLHARPRGRVRPRPALHLPAPAARLFGRGGEPGVKVLLPSPLVSCTQGRREVEVEGATLDRLLGDLDRRHPGIRLRVVDEQGAVRPHIKIFVNGEMARSLSTSLAAGDEVLVVAALSGG